MKKVFSRLLLVATVVAVMVILIDGRIWHPSDRNDSSVAMPPRIVDFGVVTYLPEIEVELTLKNDHNQPMLVNGFHASCDCTNVSPLTKVIPSCKSMIFKARISLDRYQRQFELTRKLVPIELAIAPEIMIKGQTVIDPGWKLVGCFDSPFTISPTKVVCNENEFVDHKFSAIIENIDYSHIKSVSIQSVEHADLKCTLLPAGENRLELELIGYLPRTSGRFTDWLEFDLSTRDGTSRNVKIPFLIQIVPSVRSLPSSLLFKDLSKRIAFSIYAVDGRIIKSITPKTASPDYELTIYCDGLSSNVECELQLRTTNENVPTHLELSVTASDGRIADLQIPIYFSTPAKN